MFKNVPRFSLAMLVFSSLVFVGCAKKVSSVSGSAGLSPEKRTSLTPAPSTSQSTKPKASTSEETVASGPSGLSDLPGGEAPIPSQPEEHASLGKATPEGGTAGSTPEGGRAGSTFGEEAPSHEKANRSGFVVTAPGAKFSENVYFDFDKWSIRSDTKDLLGENALWLMKHRDLQVQIEGHGDERGSNEYNLALGERRARSTRRYLINLGVDSSRISFISYGEEKGVCNEKNERCFQKNRRAHFLVKR